MRETIVEVFSSLQGEGPYVGYRQVFVRFSGCNLRCHYCDTTESFQYDKAARIEKSAGSGQFNFIPNPLAIYDLAGYVNQLLILRHHSVSLTGGEPLCHTSAIKELAPFIEVPLYLETNGVLVDELSEVLSLMHIISMDIKLPSSAGQDYFTAHRRFLKLAAHKEVFVKIVLSNQSSQGEFAEALSVIADVNKSIPLILQPVTTHDEGEKLPTTKLLTFFEMALECLEHVRVIPQMHHLLNVL